MSKRAIILAGGKGSRLRPYTVVLPKPLMPIGDYPILELIIRQLAQFNFTYITLTVNHQAELIKTYFGNGAKWGIKIDYSMETMPLSTMGPLKLVSNLPDNFLVMNGDVLTDLDFDQFYQYHLSLNNLFTVSAHVREEKSEYGILEVDKNGAMVNFKEKPVRKSLVSMGIYMVSKKILNYIPDNTAYGFDNLMIDLIKAKDPAYIKTHEGYWLDIGNPEDYMKAIDEFGKNKKKFL